MIEKELFGKLSDGREVFLYRITNGFGEYVELLNFGAAVHRLMVLDRDQKLRDVVLGVPDAGELEGFHLEGVIVGRCANRIANAQCVLDGQTIYLEKGRGGHCLHSGSSNFGTKLFQVQDGQDDENGQSVCFTLYDDGACGFGCGVAVKITYTFDDQHVLRILYDMKALGTTVLSPTSHMYFNLGCPDARDHFLFLNADAYAVCGSSGVPEGQIAPTAGTPLDFTAARTLKEAMEEDPGNFFAGRHKEYDDNVILSGKGFRKAATLCSAQSGIGMEVFTDMPSMVVFSMDLPRQLPGKDGAVYEGFCSVCLEPQFVSNAVNCPEYVSPVFHAGERLQSKTEYRFTICA